MAGSTKIEWTQGIPGYRGATWNPTLGCSSVSPGCDHCYAETESVRHQGTAPYEGVVARGGDDGRYHWTGRVNCVEERVDWPLHKTAPMCVFVNSMSDLFHEQIPDEFIARVYAVMGLANNHIFQVLTKRPQRMARLLADPAFITMWYEQRDLRAGERDVQLRAQRDDLTLAVEWPLPNVWHGTSVEQQRYAFRARHLLQTPSVVRFLSCEPLLGPLVLGQEYTGCQRCRAGGCPVHLDGPPRSVDWVIVGGESGRGARPMHPEWARSLRDECGAAGVAFLFKQWGSHMQVGVPDEGTTLVQRDGGRAEVVRVDGKLRLRWSVDWRPEVLPYTVMQRVDKHEAGRTLDGRLHDGYPTPGTGEGWNLMVGIHPRPTRSGPPGGQEAADPVPFYGPVVAS